MSKRARNMSEATGNEAADILWRALQIAAPGERAAFLDHACQGQAELRESVDQLLASHLAAETFFLEAESACRMLLGPQ
jgi:hypothetical protein